MKKPSFTLRKNLAAVLSAALLVSAPGPLAYQAAAQTLSARPVAAMPAGIGSASAGSRVNLLSAPAPLSGASLSALSAPSAVVSAPALSAAAAAPALSAAAAPSAAADPALAAAAAAPAAVPAAAPALLAAAPAASAAAAAPVNALQTGRDLGARLEAAAQPSGDVSGVKSALDSFYSGLTAAAPCIFANLGKNGKDGSHLAPSDAPAGAPNPAAVPLGRDTRFQVGIVHYTAMRAMAAIWSVWDRAIGSKWDKMPPILGEIYLYFNEQSLRLHVWDANALPTAEKKSLPPATESEKYGRSADGTYFDDQKPEMAAAGARWNQLAAPSGAPNRDFDKMDPNPLVVSEKLDKRAVGPDGRPVTKEAGILNDWAAAEIQAQVHDWGNHLRQPITKDPVRIKIPAGHPLGAAGRETEMVLDRTEQDPTLPADYAGPAVHRNSETPGWDMSNIYGSSLARQLQVRTLHDGKMKIGADGRLLDDPEKPGLPLTGFNDNITPLLAMYHTIWTLEHNAVADAVKSEHPDWNDQQIFQLARLRVTALNARLHTTEWTRALLPHPTLHAGMWADWYGFLGKPMKLWVMRFSDRNPRLGKILGWLLRYELIFGVPGTKTQHYGKNYAFVEEFFDVYRLHTMIRDWNKIQHLETTPSGENQVKFLGDIYLKDAQGFTTVPTLKAYEGDDLALSYGLESAGALTINNAPDALRDLTTQDGRHIDLTAVDIIRTRERLAASTYNAFVKRLGERPPKTFLELTGGNVEAAAALASVYKTVDDVDFTPGIRAERKPDAFALGNRQFKPFVLSAPARLKNDRFLSEQYSAATYGAAGMEYIEHTNFANLIERHYPSLRPAIEGMDNSFRPWDQPGSLNDKLANSQLASSRAAVKAAYRNILIGAAVAFIAPLIGPVSLLSFGSLLVIPAVTALFASRDLLESSGAMTKVLSDSKSGGKAQLLAPLFAAEKQGRKGALAAKLGAFTVLDVGGMIAWRLFAAHPVGALLVAAASVYSGVKTLKAAKKTAQDQQNLRVGLQAKLAADLPKTDAKDIAGDTAVDKHFWIMLNGKPGPVLKFGDTYATLRKGGSSVVEAFMTTAMWHVIYARKTWNGASAGEKARYNPGFLDINVPGLIALTDFSSNRVWADGSKPGVRRGDVDMDEFNRLFRDFGMHDYLTAYDLARIREANQHRDAVEGRGTWFKRLIGRYAGKRRADQLLELFADRVVWEDGAEGKLVPAISREQLLRFYQGGAHYDLIRDRQAGAAQ
ncbi:MAG TPA: peroxidase family protein [Elusimicrobiota bacterium]|nr:peroxidase family protein [Elusimicrobiota bacterium]